MSVANLSHFSSSRLLLESVRLGALIVESKARNVGARVSEVRSVTNSQGIVATADFFDNTRTSADTSNYKVVEPGMFVYNPSRVNVGSIGWLDEPDAVIVSPMYVVFSVDSSRVVPDYLMHFLASADGRRQIEGKTEVGARFRLTFAALASIEVSLPPLTVQRDIVEMLRVFKNLRALVEEESLAREAQFAYYRELLMSDGDPSWDWHALGEVAIVRTGQAPVKSQVSDSGDFPFVNAGTSASGYVPSSNTTGQTITIPSRGQGGVGIVGYQHEDFWCGPLCYRITARDDRLSTRFLFHYLKSIQPSIRDLQQAAGTPALNRKELVLVQVPVPSHAAQERIVATLDRLYDLLESPSGGLRAELQARQRQYEAYRDKMLTFARAAT
ncbi:restriction endonuclease subunit S [Microbacterium sp.]|uniref:restriction endonuclease subunit S n=1 Tax=Microbacterium sp. TaxID=51671 RepID=UPI003F9D8FB7